MRIYRAPAKACLRGKRRSDGTMQTAGFMPGGDIVKSATTSGGGLERLPRRSPDRRAPAKA